MYMVVLGEFGNHLIANEVPRPEVVAFLLREGYNDISVLLEWGGTLPREELGNREVPSEVQYKDHSS